MQMQKIGNFSQIPLQLIKLDQDTSFLFTLLWEKDKVQHFANIKIGNAFLYFEKH